jgi:hypothetical protein
LHGLALVGSKSAAGEEGKVLWGIGIAPRRNLTVPATEETVKAMGLKHGIKVTAADLGGF